LGSCLYGHIHDGAIVLDERIPLSEGTAVEVQVIASQPKEVCAADSDTRSLPTLAERLKEVIGILDDLPEDAARNHDHYLYGAPKQS
jgi:hypothetical protein